MSINLMLGKSVSTASTILGRTGISSVMGQILAGGGGGTPMLIAETKKEGAGNTPDRDTTGANFIIVAATWYTGGGGTRIVSDTFSNFYTPLNDYDNSGVYSTQLFYYYGTNVGSGHHWSFSGPFSSILVAAFSNIASSPIDQQNGFTSTGASTIAPGSITPSQANTLVITAVGSEALSTITIADGTYNVTDTTQFGSGVGMAGGLAYKLLTSPTPQNPTWNLGGTNFAQQAAIVSVKY